MNSLHGMAVAVKLAINGSPLGSWKLLQTSDFYSFFTTFAVAAAVLLGCASKVICSARLVKQQAEHYTTDWHLFLILINDCWGFINVGFIQPPNSQSKFYDSA
jgi:hypothetical protein